MSRTISRRLMSIRPTWPLPQHLVSAHEKVSSIFVWDVFSLTFCLHNALRCPVLIWLVPGPHL